MPWIAAEVAAAGPETAAGVQISSSASAVPDAPETECVVTSNRPPCLSSSSVGTSAASSAHTYGNCSRVIGPEPASCTARYPSSSAASKGIALISQAQHHRIRPSVRHEWVGRAQFADLADRCDRQSRCLPQRVRQVDVDSLAHWRAGLLVPYGQRPGGEAPLLLVDHVQRGRCAGRGQEEDEYGGDRGEAACTAAAWLPLRRRPVRAVPCWLRHAADPDGRSIHQATLRPRSEAGTAFVGIGPGAGRRLEEAGPDRRQPSTPVSLHPFRAPCVGRAL